MEWEMSGKLAEMEGDGTCVSLVHADVYHPEPGWHGHAWVETSTPAKIRDLNGEDFYFPLTTVHDHSNGQQVVMPAPVYYLFGCVRNPKRYSWDAARRFLLKNKIYGPWEDEDGDVSREALSEAAAGREAGPEGRQVEARRRVRAGSACR